MTSRDCYGRPSLLSSPGALSFSAVLISLVTPKAARRIYVDHIQLWAVAVCKLLFQPTVAIMKTNIRTVIIGNIARFSCLDLPQTKAQRIMESQKVPSKKSYAVFVRATGLPWSYVSIYWRRSHVEKFAPFAVSWSEGAFSQRPGSGLSR